MTFEEAIVKSVRAYFKGKDPENLMGAFSEKTRAEKDSEELDEDSASGPPQKYTRSYLDELEASLLEDEDAAGKTTSKKRRKKDKDKEKEESEDTSGMGGMGDMDEEDVDSLMGGLLSKPVRKKKR